MENPCISKEDISKSTFSRFLNRGGYYYLQARKKGLLKNIDLQRIFARSEYPFYVWTHDICSISTVQHLHTRSRNPWIKSNPNPNPKGPEFGGGEYLEESVRMYCKGAKFRHWGANGESNEAISFDKGVVICKTYEKLDGRHFADFIDENFESIFAVADKVH